MAKVVVLGAGASVGAGYPTANELLAAVGEHCRYSRMNRICDRWQEWSDFQKESSSREFGTLLNARNPEIVLSALDLLEHRDDDSLNALFVGAAQTDKTGDPSHYVSAEKARELFASLTRSARLVRRSLMTCLQDYFRCKTADDRRDPTRREYLRTFFRKLAEGDTVITFNWDTLAEQTLAEMGLWNPTLGYGVRVPLRRRPIDACRSWRSPVTVLKLHGSVGWEEAESRPGELLLSGPYLLQHLAVRLPTEKRPAVLAAARSEEIFEERVDLQTLPTFLKQTATDGVMQDIWWRAQQVLARTSRVEVWGYSLPESDGAARVLFNGLRHRLATGKVAIVVTDPSESTRDRWNTFLGARVARNGRLGASANELVRQSRGAGPRARRRPTQSQASR